MLRKGAERISLGANSAAFAGEFVRIRLGKVEEPEAAREAYRQAKHHRWCLGRSQVLQHDLGGQIPSTKRCWENSHIGKRDIFFATIGGWLTFQPLKGAHWVHGQRTVQ